MNPQDTQEDNLDLAPESEGKKSEGEAGEADNTAEDSSGISLEAKVADLEQRLVKDPKNFDILFEIASTYRKMEKIDLTLQFIDKALEIIPDHAESLNLKGEAFLVIGSINEALTYFSRAINANPMLEQPWFNKAVILGQNGLVDEATYNIDMALKLNPQNKKAHDIRKAVLESKIREKKVWLFVGTKETWDTKFALGGAWGMHGNAPDIQTFFQISEGDLIISYKRNPDDEVFALFDVQSPMYTDHSTMWRYRIDLEPRIKLRKKLSLKDLKRSTKLSKKWEFITNPDPMRTIFEINPDNWRIIKTLIQKKNPDLRKDALDIDRRGKSETPLYNLDINSITNQVPISPSTIREIQTHLKSGRNVILYGPPGSGKEKLATLVSEQICGKRIQSKGLDLSNFTSKIANPLWGEEEIIGYWGDEVDKMIFYNGFGSQAIEWCGDSLRDTERPHYMIINKMDNLDLDRCFNKFLSIANKRESSIIISFNRDLTKSVRVPKEFRIIGTADSDGMSIPENLAELKGKFSFIEVSMPEKTLEYEKIPFLVRERLLSLGTLNPETLMKWKFTKVEGEISRFDNDTDGSIQRAYDVLMQFISKDKYPPKGMVIPRGMRTYKAIGTQLLVETMLCVVNAPKESEKALALEDACISVIFPLMEEIAPKDLLNIQLRAKEAFGVGSKVVEMLSAFISKLGGDELLDAVKEEEKKVNDWADEDELSELVIAAAEVNPTEVKTDVDLTPVFDTLSISKKTLSQIIVNLESGRNIILYGAPGCGKTKVSTLLCDQLCGMMPQKGGGEKHNYTVVTANAEWDNFDIVGGVSPKVDKYTHEISYEFRDGCVTAAVRECLLALKRLARPHYLIIDEFNRANIDEAFGKLFTVFEYRDIQPLLNQEENKGNDLYIPRHFRIIGTMNVQDKNTLFDIGHALMRRFAFIEIGLPDEDDEYERMPHFIELRAKEIGINLKGEVSSTSPFRGDPEGKVNVEYKKLMKFLKWQKAPEEGIEMPVGVRTYMKIGTAQIIDCIIWTLNVSGDYTHEEAMQDSIIANILPQLENMETAWMNNIYLRAAEVFGERARLAQAVDKMRKSTSMSIFS